MPHWECRIRSVESVASWLDFRRGTTTPYTLEQTQPLTPDTDQHTRARARAPAPRTYADARRTLPHARTQAHASEPHPIHALYPSFTPDSRPVPIIHTRYTLYTHHAPLARPLHAIFQATRHFLSTPQYARPLPIIHTTATPYSRPLHTLSQTTRHFLYLMRDDAHLLTFAGVSLVIAAAGEATVPLMYGRVIDSVVITHDPEACGCLVVVGVWWW